MFSKCALVTIAATLMAFSGFAAQNEGVIDYGTHDAAMNAAQSEAQVHLDRFYDHVLDDNGIAIQGAGVKVAFPISGNDVEVMWISPFGVRDGRMIGVLANQPRDIQDKNAGDRVEFSADQVRDWYFFGADGKMYGSYTTRVMLADLDADTAAQIAEMLSDNPLPADW